MACNLHAHSDCAYAFARGTDAVFLVGDSLVGQLCLLASVALCTNTTKPHAPGKWQHLEQHIARTENGREIPAYQVSPEICQSCTNIKAAHAAADFIHSRATKKSLLVIGMLGAHFMHDRDLDMYLQNLKFYLVDAFPGTIVKLGPVHQHFATNTNEYTRRAQCAPLTRLGQLRIEQRTLDFAAIMGTDVIQLANITERAHYCHRAVAKNAQIDCTHYQNAIYDKMKREIAKRSSAIVAYKPRLT